MDNSNDPAYPCKRMEDVPEYHSPDITVSSLVDYHGLTKRELFAAMAMQGYCSVQEGWDQPAREVAKCAALMADALLAALNAEESK